MFNSSLDKEEKQSRLSALGWMGDPSCLLASAFQKYYKSIKCILIVIFKY